MGCSGFTGSGGTARATTWPIWPGSLPVAEPRPLGRRRCRRPRSPRAGGGGRSSASLLEGRHPVTGQPLGSGRTTVAAFDLTFSAPKSASVLFALGGDDVARRIVGVHTEAVAGAMAYLERHGVTARCDGPDPSRRSSERSGGAGRRRSPTASTATSIRICTATSSWPTWCTGPTGAGGRVISRGLWAHRAAGGAVYEAHLRAGLAAELGVRLVRVDGGGPEIEGMAPDLLGEFSSRSADIRRHAFEHGARSAAGPARGVGGDPAGQGGGDAVSGAGAGVGAAGRGGRWGRGVAVRWKGWSGWGGRGRRGRRPDRTGAGWSTSTASPG